MKLNTPILFFIFLFLFFGCDDKKKPIKTSPSPIPPLSKLQNKKNAPKILVLGDSLTAGLGLKEEENYPSILQNRLKEQGYPHQVINGGESGGTTKGGIARLEWLIEENPEIVIIELGANDALRGLPVEDMRENLEKMILICRDKKAQVLLTGMYSPPNLGVQYAESFKRVYEELAEQHQLVFMPFFLEGVAAQRQLNQRDGIHPTHEGYKIIVENLWKYLEPMLPKNKS